MPKRRQHELWGHRAVSNVPRLGESLIFMFPHFSNGVAVRYGPYGSQSTSTVSGYGRLQISCLICSSLSPPYPPSTSEFSQLTQKQRFYLIKNLQSLSFLMKASSWTRPALVLCTTTPTVSFQRIVALMEQKGELIGKWESNLQSF